MTGAGVRGGSERAGGKGVNRIKVPFRGVHTRVKQIYLYLYKICKYIEVPYT